MKQVTISKAELNGFRGSAQMLVEFDQKQTSICGQNGTGKSRMYDAFLWCLYGVDQLGRTDYEIKTRDDGGTEIPHKDSSVAYTLVIDGHEHTFKRILTEKWVKPVGKAEAVYQGNTTKYYIDDVPYKANEYASQVVEMIGTKDTLYSVIDPLYFASKLEWKQRREFLFGMAGCDTIPEDTFAMGDKHIIDMLNGLEGKTIDARKKELNDKAKVLRKDLEQFPIRISQSEAMKPQAIDFDNAQKCLDEVEEKIKAVDTKLGTAIASGDELAKQTATLSAEYRKYVAQAEEAYKDACTKADKEAEEANAELVQLTNKIKGANTRLATASDMHDGMSKQLFSLNASVTRTHYTIEAARRSLDAKREEYKTIKGYASKCDGCELQRNVLESSLQSGRAAKRELDNIEADYKALQQEVADLTASTEAKAKLVADIEDEIKSLNAELKKHTEVKAVYPKKEDVEGYVSAIKEAYKVEEQLKHVGEKRSTAEIKELEADKKNLMEQRDTYLANINRREQIKRVDEEIARLNQEAADKNSQLLVLEQELLAIEDYTHNKISMLTDRVNDMFGKVQWKMFEYTIDGNAKECCIPMVDGVYFESANTAGRVNAGIDIINTIAERIGLRAPIFIDNREGVNSIRATKSQVINLIVTDDEELTIK